MLVTPERFRDALQFLTNTVIGAHLSPRDVRLLSLHLEARPLTPIEAMRVLTRVGWHT
jgi:hypothetical protein